MISNSSYTQLKALVRLLDDPDADVYENVHGKLVSFGKNVIPLLETEWELNEQFRIQQRIEQIIDEIEFESCRDALADWNLQSDNDLLEGVLIASAFQYPTIDRKTIYSSIEQLRKDIWIELSPNLTSLEKVRVINHILFDVHHFKPHTKYHDSFQSFFINNVINLESGSPIALAILYKILADKLDLPIECLNLPYHMVLGYCDTHNDTENDMLFYINPFSNGAVFGRGELERFIEKAKVNMHFNELNSMNNSQIVKRMLIEIKLCYQRLGKYQKLDQVNQLLQVLSKGNN